MQRFHCFPCGADGDCYDLIQRMRGVSFPDAINVADDLLDTMPPGWKERLKIGSPQGDEADITKWYAYVEDSRRRAADPQNYGTVCVVASLLPLDADEMERRQADTILRRLGWGVDEDGKLTIPHWTEDGIFTAVKTRAMDGRKGGKKGNKFPELYGSWIPQRYKAVLLCEGETDMGWASLQEPHVDIRALPAGAGTLRDKFYDQLKRWETVYLALDPDKAGIQATRLLTMALGSDRVRICTLPRGKDLRDVRPNLDRLLERAIVPPVDSSGITTVNGVFERVGAQGNNRQLTSWIAAPTARLIPGDEDEELDTAFELEIEWAGHTRSEALHAGDLNSPSKLKSWLFTKNLDWLGGDGDVAALQAHLNSHAATMPEVYQSARLGIHRAPRQYSYAGKSLVLPDGYIGNLPWKFTNEDVAGTDVLISAERELGPPDYRWLEYLQWMHDPSAMHVILAWFAASTRRTDVKDFPLLFVGGPSGSGKSATAQMMCRMFGSRLGYHLGNATGFTITKMLSATTTIPIFLDEWSKQSRQDARAAIQAAIPHIYEGGIVPRGTRDQTVNKYRCTSPVVIAGEDSFRLDRERDRMVMVELTRAGQNADIHAWLATQQLERFGYWYNRWILEAQGLPPMPVAGNSPNRPTYAKEVLRAGWETLRCFLLDAENRGAPNVPQLPTINLDALDRQEETRTNEYEELLLAALGQVDSSGIDLVWEDEEGVYVRFAAITSPAFLSKLDITPPGDSAAMKRYFESLGYPVVSTRRQPPLGHRIIRAHLIAGYNLKDDDK